jgi:hypothetical protein
MTAAAVRVHNGIAREIHDARCLLAVQAKVRGYQDLRVTGENAQASGCGYGYISVRVGQVLLYLEDREAMFSWVAAIQRALELQDRAYGPELPPAQVGRRVA